MKRILLGWRYGLLAAGLAVIVLLVIDFNSRMTEWRRLTVLKEQVGVQATSAIQTQWSLETEIAYATSPAGVLEWAYEEGHMARPEDHLVVPIAPPGETPEPTPAPTAAQEPVSNWELWLSLFFDPVTP